MEPTSRERLLDAARACLLEHGHAACSVKVIARMAGLNHGLVHHYFGSKEALWAEVVRREAEHVRDSLAQHAGTFLEGFYGPQLLRHPDRMRLALEFLALAKSNPAVAQAVRAHFRVNREALRERLGLEQESTATLAFGALFGLVIQGGLDPELPVEAAVQELMALLGRSDRPAAAAGSPPRARRTKG